MVRCCSYLYTGNSKLIAPSSDLSTIHCLSSLVLILLLDHSKNVVFPPNHSNDYVLTIHTQDRSSVFDKIWILC